MPKNLQMQVMHLAVDAHNVLEDRRGIGVYVRAVLSRLLARSDVTITLLVREHFPQRLHRRIAAELGTERFALRRRMPRDADVAWHPWNGIFFPSSTPAVATIHDCAPFAYPAPDEHTRRSQQAPFRAGAATARRVLTDSAFSRTEIERWLAVASERIAVVPLAADPGFTAGEARELPALLRERRYVLYVGADEARKNLATLTAAWRERLVRDVDLVCVGASGGEGTTQLRGLSIDRLCDLYRGALAVAVPSLYEGFGLPAVEAMASGAPVICARAASLPEVCGDAARYIDDPLDAAAWREALDELALDADLRGRLREAGAKRARVFSWDRCTEETLAVLRAAAEA